MGPFIGMYHAPRLPVLRGVIESMFLTYESIVQWNRQALSLWHLPVTAEIYFHKSQASFSSNRHRQSWSKYVAGMEDISQSHQSRGGDGATDPTRDSLQEEQRPGGAIKFGQMKLADSYTTLLAKAGQSNTTIWTALFLTYDKSWHYWRVVLI
jgi:hypothetical protein